MILSVILMLDSVNPGDPKWAVDLASWSSPQVSTSTPIFFWVQNLQLHFFILCLIYEYEKKC